MENRDPKNIGQTDESKDAPLASVVLIGRNERDTAETVGSLAAQTYPHWELLLLVGLSFSDIERYGKRTNIRTVIADGSDEELFSAAGSLIRGEYVLILKEGDVLSKEAFYLMTRDKNADLVYADSDNLESGERTRPSFKPAFSPVTEICFDYVKRPLMVKKELHDEVGFDTDAHLYAVKLMRLAKKPVNVGKVLLTAKPEKKESAKTFRVTETLDACAGRFEGSFRIGAAVIKKKTAGIVIDCPDSAETLVKCLGSVDTRLTYFDRKLIIALGFEPEGKLKAYLDALKRNRAAVIVRTKTEKLPAVLNAGAARANADYIVFLSGTAEVISSDLIESLTEPLRIKGVSISGGKLFYPDGRLFHTGQVVGLGGWVGSLYRGERDDMADETKCFYTALTRNVSSVSGMLMAVSSEDLANIGMFDESFSNIGWDTEFCLRARAKGRQTIYTPYASARLLNMPPDFDTAPAGDLERCYDVIRETLLSGDPYYSLNYDYSSGIPRIAEKPTKPIVLNPMF